MKYLMCVAVGAAYAAGMRRRRPPNDASVQIHDDWLAADQEFVDELAALIQRTYRKERHGT